MTVALMVVVLGTLFGPALLTHARNASDPLRVNDDALQQIWPFLRYRDAAALQDDYLTDYQLDMNPIGFGGLYRFTAPWLDPRTLSTYLPYLLLGALVVLVGRTTWLLAGPTQAACSVAICLSTDVFLEYMAGGLPRAFAFPLTALAGYGLAAGRPIVTASAAVLGAAFYYPTGVLAGVALALSMLVPRVAAGSNARRWTSPKRLGLVAATAITCLVVMASSLIAMRAYGDSLGPGDWEAYPEAAPGGRLRAQDIVRRTPLLEVVPATYYYIDRTINVTGTPWNSVVRTFGLVEQRRITALVVLVVALGSISFVVRRHQGASRFLVLLLAALATYLLAWLVIPRLYVPERFLRFTIPIGIAVLIPVAVSSLVSWLPVRRLAPLAAVLSTTALILLTGSRGPIAAGLMPSAPTELVAVADFVETLPDTAMLAGWPSTLNRIPYATGRRVLLTREIHLPFHRTYVEELRRRMETLADAYFAITQQPIDILRSRYGVTHLLLDRRHLIDEAPTYFEPFGSAIPEVTPETRDRWELLRLEDRLAVFRAGELVVLDLTRLDSDAPSALIGRR